MKRAKYYILGAYLLLLLDGISSYYLYEELRRDHEATQIIQQKVIGGLAHVWQELQFHLNMN